MNGLLMGTKRHRMGPCEASDFLNQKKQLTPCVASHSTLSYTAYSSPTDPIFTPRRYLFVNLSYYSLAVRKPRFEYHRAEYALLLHFLLCLPFLLPNMYKSRGDNLCKNCKRPGHFARDCPNVAICHNCGLPGHIASECTTKSLCWNCREPGHMASNCPNEGICHTCGKAGHRARECTAPPLPPGDLRLCNNCYKQGHIAADCTNEKACNNCRKTGHLARDCPNDPICNMCNVSGHVARQCPKGNILERGGGGGGGVRGSGYRDIVCRNCQQLGHMSRDCMGPLMICHNCGGRGHLAYECPSGRFMDRYPRRY
ncbi:hypothetical protein FEM48_Zijuj09G0097000 [Ziziphus jujuba var. spinosa]|uniref:CCHC-type domain-containing protein n=1 Tax=Ziziphus jujuba var. spinosa TaxID=714518 RepID=A0A978US96_ZIZJJ|nr:hypothetical protein FEM48_Zijuj09G0097000 [Ziziphus jujuba var. spinosa]